MGGMQGGAGDIPWEGTPAELGLGLYCLLMRRYWRIQPLVGYVVLCLLGAWRCCMGLVVCVLLRLMCLVGLLRCCMGLVVCVLLCLLCLDRLLRLMISLLLLVCRLSILMQWLLRLLVRLLCLLLVRLLLCLLLVRLLLLLLVRLLLINWLLLLRWRLCGCSSLSRRFMVACSRLCLCGESSRHRGRPWSPRCC